MTSYSEMISTLDNDKLAYLLKRLDGRRKHKLLTKADAKRLPKLYATDETPRDEKTAVVKFFSIRSQATWYAIEFDGERTFFGWADLGNGMPELGYFDLYELGLLTFSKYGVPSIERDRFFTPCKLSEVL